MPLCEDHDCAGLQRRGHALGRPGGEARANTDDGIREAAAGQWRRRRWCWQRADDDGLRVAIIVEMAVRWRSSIRAAPLGSQAPGKRAPRAPVWWRENPGLAWRLTLKLLSRPAWRLPAPATPHPR